MKKYGYLRAELIKAPKIEWAQYSDLNNFTLIEEGERHDEGLSKRHNKPIYQKVKKYQFKGYEAFTYTIMENPLEPRRPKVEKASSVVKKKK